MYCGAVNSDSGQYERGGSEGRMLSSIILGRGGFSAEWLLVRLVDWVLFNQAAADSALAGLPVPGTGFFRNDSPVIVKR